MRKVREAVASRLVARVVGEIVGYRLFASLRCQRTQARSHPLSSSRAKATAAGSGGDGGGCSSSVGTIYGPVYREKIRGERVKCCRWRHTAESGDRGGSALRVRAQEGEKPAEG